MNIDEIAEEIVFSFWDEKHLEEYSGSNRESLLQRIQETKKQAIKNMLYQMHYEESMFSAGVVAALKRLFGRVGIHAAHGRNHNRDPRNHFNGACIFETLNTEPQTFIIR